MMLDFTVEHKLTPKRSIAIHFALGNLAPPSKYRITGEPHTFWQCCGFWRSELQSSCLPSKLYPVNHPLVLANILNAYAYPYPYM